MKLHLSIFLCLWFSLGAARGQSITLAEAEEEIFHINTQPLKKFTLVRDEETEIRWGIFKEGMYTENSDGTHFFTWIRWDRSENITIGVGQKMKGTN